MTRDLLDTAPVRALGRRQVPKRIGAPDLAELEHALTLAARAVLIYGEKFMPIFARIERECDALRAQDRVIDRVRALATRAA